VRRHGNPFKGAVISVSLVLLASCATDDTYMDPTMDFGSLQTVAVLPFRNLTNVDHAADRVRDAFTSMLLATGSVYVLPPGEVARGMALIGRFSPDGPTVEQIKKLAGVLEVDAVITGVVTEYGLVRSGATSANVIESETGMVVWSASTTQGGITIWDRLVGGGGEPMTDVTVKAVNDLLDKLFQ
jgi:TolB-like protein